MALWRKVRLPSLSPRPYLPSLPLLVCPTVSALLASGALCSLVVEEGVVAKVAVGCALMAWAMLGDAGWGAGVVAGDGVGNGNSRGGVGDDVGNGDGRGGVGRMAEAVGKGGGLLLCVGEGRCQRMATAMTPVVMVTLTVRWWTGRMAMARRIVVSSSSMESKPERNSGMGRGHLGRGSRPAQRQCQRGGSVEARESRRCQRVLSVGEGCCDVRKARLGGGGEEGNGSRGGESRPGVEARGGEEGMRRASEEEEPEVPIDESMNSDDLLGDDGTYSEPGYKEVIPRPKTEFATRPASPHLMDV
ncbi:hypothetical protein CPC08DRAFT_731366 [Agrocybe pediades]|nr:hypothetical protein CPC08DRAFT_731366 [Agrocybe pediades]